MFWTETSPGLSAEQPAPVCYSDTIWLQCLTLSFSLLLSCHNPHDTAMWGSTRDWLQTTCPGHIYWAINKNKATQSPWTHRAQTSQEKRKIKQKQLRNLSRRILSCNFHLSSKLGNLQQHYRLCQHFTVLSSETHLMPNSVICLLASTPWWSKHMVL